MIETYKRAETIATTIEYEIKNHIFDPQMYVKADLRKFWAVNLLEQFENKKMKQIAPAYKRIYRRAIRVAKEFFKIQDVRDIHKVDIDNYVEDCRQRYPTWGDKTLKNNIDIFKTFMNYLHDLEVISKVPPFSTIDYTDKTFKWVSGDEQIKLYNMVPDKHKPFIGFLMLHGCRPGEARALKCKDVDLEKGAMTITASFSGNVYQLRRKGKKSKPYIIPVHPEMYDYVAAIVKNAHPEAFLLPNPNTGRPYSMKAIETIWSAVRKQAGIGPGELRLYDATRHSFASQLVNAGRSLFIVSKALGHNSEKTTERFYAHADLEKMRTDLSAISLKNKQTVTTLSPGKNDIRKDK